MPKLHLTLAELCLTQAKTWLTQAKFCPNSAKKSPNSNFRRVVVSARQKSAEKKPWICHTKTLNMLFINSDGDEDDEGMSMYQTEVRLSSPTSRIQLKLTGLSDTCWVMGIFASVGESRQPSQSTTSHFDMTHVNQLLDSKQLSNSAVKFKSLFETFNRGGGPQIDQLLLHQQIPASPSSLLSLMSTAKGDEPNNVYTKPSTSTSVNSDSKACEKCHTLTALETKLMKRIDELERKQDEKFQQLSQLILSLQVTKN